MMLVFSFLTNPLHQALMTKSSKLITLLVFSFSLCCFFLPWLWGGGRWGKVNQTTASNRPFLEKLFAAVGLCGCAPAFSSCRDWGLLCSQVHRLLAAVASLVEEPGVYSMGSAVSHEFSYPAACGIFPTRDGTCVPCIGRHIRNHWTTRKIPKQAFLCHFYIQLMST